MKLYLADARLTPDTGLAQREMMRIYLADGGISNLGYAQPGIPWVSRFRVLLSYQYFKQVDLDELFATYFVRPYPELFLDSGAFSAMTQGVTINLHEYAQYIRRFQHLITMYANLDVIKNAEATWQNQQRMEKEYGLLPLPVFHVLEDWQYFDRYLDRYPYIALGVAGNSSHLYMPWLVKCFKRAGSQSVFHGFGITTWNVLKSFPWYSVDSSSWGQGHRFGHVPVFHSRLGQFVKISLGDHASCYKYATQVRLLGFDPADFADRTRNTRQKVCALSALSYMQAEQWIEKRWGEVTIPVREEVTA